MRCVPLRSALAVHSKSAWQALLAASIAAIGVDLHKELLQDGFLPRPAVPEGREEEPSVEPVANPFRAAIDGMLTKRKRRAAAVSEQQAIDNSIMPSVTVVASEATKDDLDNLPSIQEAFVVGSYATEPGDQQLAPQQQQFEQQQSDATGNISAIDMVTDDTEQRDAVWDAFAQYEAEALMRAEGEASGGEQEAQREKRAGAGDAPQSMSDMVMPSSVQEWLSSTQPPEEGGELPPLSAAAAAAARIAVEHEASEESAAAGGEPIDRSALARRIAKVRQWRMPQPSAGAREGDDLLAGLPQRIAELGLPEVKVFGDTDEPERWLRWDVTQQIFQQMPYEWLLQLGTAEQPGQPRLALRRAVRVFKACTVKSSDRLYACLAGMRHLIAFSEAEELVCFPPSGDLILEALEEYKDAALERGAARRDAMEARGADVSRHRAGATAVNRIRRGYAFLGKVAGLPGFAFASSEAAKEVAAAGPCMPKVQPMTDLRSLPIWERNMLDTSMTEYVRARSGGFWLKAAASPRTKDMQRTPTLSFERHMCLGAHVNMASGIAERSKASSEVRMRQLNWRAVLIPVAEESLNLDPLLESMRSAGSTGVFVAYTVPEGAKYCLANANGWASRVATHAELEADEAELLEDELPEVAAELTGHWDRHVMPTVGRIIELPYAKRVSLGYWADPPTVGDPKDAATYARAVRVARERRSKCGRIVRCTDRYSSEGAEPVEMDEARAACMLAIRAGFKRWGKEGKGGVPTTVDAQLRDISRLHQKAFDRLEGATAPSPGGSKAGTEDEE